MCLVSHLMSFNHAVSFRGSFTSRCRIETLPNIQYPKKEKNNCLNGCSKVICTILYLFFLTFQPNQKIEKKNFIFLKKFSLHRKIYKIISILFSIYYLYFLSSYLPFYFISLIQTKCKMVLQTKLFSLFFKIKIF